MFVVLCIYYCYLTYYMYFIYRTSIPVLYTVYTVLYIQLSTSYTTHYIDMFAFDLYDKDSSGELSPSEVERMLQDIYGKQESKTNFLAKT